MAQTANAAAPTAGNARRKKMLRLVIGAVILVVLVGAGWFFKAQSKKRAEAGAVKTAQVTRGTIVQKISSTGAVTAETGAQVKIGSQITGRIKRLYADVGSQVQANQVIAELDAPDLKANLEAAQRSYAQAVSRYQQQLAGVQMQHTQVSSALEQSGDALTSARARAQQARIANGAALSRLKSANSGLEGARARQRSAEARLRSTQAAAALQATQGSSDVIRAKAALSTAQANLTESQKSSDVSVANAVTALKQAQANASLAATNLKRQEGLLANGFVAPSEVDAARTDRDNTAQVLEAAQNSLEATRAQATAQVQAAKDSVDQAKAALDTAMASSYTTAMRTEDVRAAEADLDSARTGVTQAEMSVETARADVTTARSQITSADSDVRSARAAQQTALGNLTQDTLKQQDVKTAFEAMQQSRAQVAFQEAQYAKSYIRSPISGTVISLAQQEGETVAAGLSAPELIQVAALDRLEVIAYVDETDIGKLRLGQDAEITVDAFPKHKFAGKVYKISSAATMQQNVVTYACSIHLDKYRVGMLKPQMTADVQIILAKADNLLLVPNEALKQTRNGAGGGSSGGAPGGARGGAAGGPSRGARGGAAGGPSGGSPRGAPGGGPGGPQIVTQVVTLEGDKGELKEITVGRTDGSFTEVVSGLKDGDTVVLAGFEKLGIEGLSSSAGLPRFMSNRTPFGTAPSGRGGGPGGGGGRGGGGRGGGGGR